VQQQLESATQTLTDLQEQCARLRTDLDTAFAQRSATVTATAKLQRELEQSQREQHETEAELEMTRQLLDKTVKERREKEAKRASVSAQDLELERKAHEIEVQSLRGKVSQLQERLDGERAAGEQQRQAWQQAEAKATAERAGAAEEQAQALRESQRTEAELRAQLQQREAAAQRADSQLAQLAKQAVALQDKLDSALTEAADRAAYAACCLVRAHRLTGCCSCHVTG
jgi:chromosome segregation ATPase